MSFKNSVQNIVETVLLLTQTAVITNMPSSKSYHCLEINWVFFSLSFF